MNLDYYYKYYLTEPDKFKQLVNERVNNIVAVKTGLYIHPFDPIQKKLPQKYEIFYLPIPQLSALKDQVYKNSNLINQKMSKLPNVAAQQLFFNTLIFELQSTNDIEGVRSSKQELESAMDSALKKSKESKRFLGLVKQYLNIEKGKFNQIKDIKEFRTIWDELVKQEKMDQLPDGKLFRSKPESIMAGIKVIHEGDPTEKDIMADLTALVKEMNVDDSDIPALEKCFIAHYFYEYVHPFYDGNGRTGRFITCSYLARKLDIMTSISFSSAIAQNKNYYYKSFKNMSNQHNFGEATNFIIHMLKILEKGQNNFIKRLDYGDKLLTQANELIASYNLDRNLSELLELYFQKHIFGTYTPNITDEQLTEILHQSRYHIRRYTSELEEKGLITVLKEKPKPMLFHLNYKNKLKLCINSYR